MGNHNSNNNESTKYPLNDPHVLKLQLFLNDSSSISEIFSAYSESKRSILLKIMGNLGSSISNQVQSLLSPIINFPSFSSIKLNENESKNTNEYYKRANEFVYTFVHSNNLYSVLELLNIDLNSDSSSSFLFYNPSTKLIYSSELIQLFISITINTNNFSKKKEISPFLTSLTFLDSLILDHFGYQKGSKLLHIWSIVNFAPTSSKHFHSSLVDWSNISSSFISSYLRSAPDFSSESNLIVLKKCVEMNGKLMKGMDYLLNPEFNEFDLLELMHICPLIKWPINPENFYLKSNPSPNLTGLRAIRSQLSITSQPSSLIMDYLSNPTTELYLNDELFSNLLCSLKPDDRSYSLISSYLSVVHSNEINPSLLKELLPASGPRIYDVGLNASPIYCYLMKNSSINVQGLESIIQSLGTNCLSTVHQRLETLPWLLGSPYFHPMKNMDLLDYLLNRIGSNTIGGPSIQELEHTIIQSCSALFHSPSLYSIRFGSPSSLKLIAMNYVSNHNIPYSKLTLTLDLINDLENFKSGLWMKSTYSSIKTYFDPKKVCTNIILVLEAIRLKFPDPFIDPNLNLSQALSSCIKRHFTSKFIQDQVIESLFNAGLINMK